MGEKDPKTVLYIALYRYARAIYKNSKTDFTSYVYGDAQYTV